MTLTELDTRRAETMRRLLNDTGAQEIWKYDIITRRAALFEALDQQNYDNIQRGREAAGKPYALIGPGIEDHYFATVEELDGILTWLCVEGGYLSCYKAGTPAAEATAL